MAGEQEVDAGIGDRVEGMLGAADGPASGRERRRHQGMMSDERAKRLASHLSEEAADLVHLAMRDAAVAEGRGARRVDAEDGELGIAKERIVQRRDVVPETLERPERAPQGVVERDVVIAGNGDDRRLELVEEGARR